MSDVQARIAGLSPEKLRLLARRLKKVPGEAALPTVVLAPEERYEPFPLTDVQQAYWLGRQGLFELGNVASHAYGEIPFPGLDVERLNSALNRLIARHEMLRAIVLPDGRQQILPEVPAYRAEVLDLRGIDPQEAEVRLAEVRERMSHQVLPADRWPLFEIRVSQLDDARFLMHLSFDILIGDLWSFQLLRRELDQLYLDANAELRPLELSFRDYVRAQVAFEQTPVYERSLAYWRERLADLPLAPELPLLITPSALEKPRFRRRNASLAPEPWERLREQATREGLTPSGLLLAAYAEVLSTWSKSPRFTINVTTFNRLPVHPQVNEVVGDFTSLTLVAVDMGGGGPFAERAARVQRQLWRDLEHSQVSAVRLLRQMSRSAAAPGAAMPVVFTSMLFEGGVEERRAAERRRPAASRTDGLGHSISQTPQVWLDFQVSEDDGALTYNWDAVEDLFPPGLLDQMFAAYSRLLDELATGEAAWSRSLGPLLPATQLQQRLQLNATASPRPTRRLHELFEEQARLAPDRTAVLAADARLTYADVERGANRLAHELRRAGAGPNRLVAVVMEKGWEQVVAVLAVLKSGGAYLPVDPELPPERFRHLLERGEVRVALTRPRFVAALEWPADILRLPVTADHLEGPPEEPLEPVQELEDLAYVIFTSGSTGLPKGVMIDHRGAVNTILDINRRFGVGAGDRVLALSSLSFDLSVYDIFGLLAAGGAVVVPESDALRNPGRWLELLAGEQVTVWNSVPALMQMLVEHIGDRVSPHLRDLRLVLLSGDWIPVALPDQIRAAAPAAEVVSLGGATEASIWSVLYPIGAVDPAWRSIPYGRPMDNQSLEVLDHRLEPRPVWVPGDLYIGGIGLAQGYWRDGERTALSFMEHLADGRRLYRTGDLARYLPDGNLEFLGREDLQVKIQGYRIELGEIETVLEQHPAVRSGVVVPLVDATGGRRLVAGVVLDPGAMSSRWLVSSPSDPPVPAGAHPEGISLALAGSDTALREPGGTIQGRARIAAAPVRRTELHELLACLRQIRLRDALLPKYRYPSAGSLYPVQTYVVVAPGRVEGLAAGAYYYHPKEHGLIALDDGMCLAPEELTGAEPESAGRSAFSLFLVGQLAAIEPIYGEWSRSFCMLEAGYMGRLLRGAAAELGLCLTPAGPVEAGKVRRSFGLDDGHVLLQTLLGGVADDSDSPAPSAPTEPGLRSWSPAAPILSAGGVRPVFEAIHGPLEQGAFKLSEPGLRRTTAQLPVLPCGLAEPDERTARLFTARRTHREFRREPVGLPALGGLLRDLSRADLRGVAIPQPFADALPAVRIYLHARPNRVAGVPAGIYRYHVEHLRLVQVSAGDEIGAGVHAPVNRGVFEQGAFSLFFTADPAATDPGLAPWALDFATLEAGCMGQVLMEAAAGYALGLCPIGTVEFDRIRHLFHLEPGQVLLHSVVGGSVEGDPLLAHRADPIAGGEEASFESELREFLRRKLPDYMVPASIVALNEIPLTANGKVDRKSLANWLSLPQQPKAAYAPPRTELERRIANIWEEVLGIARVGMNDSFFELGGHSMAMMQVHRKLQESTGKEISVVQMFAHPTPRTLAAYLGRDDSAVPSLREDRNRAEMRRAARYRRRSGQGAVEEGREPGDEA